MSTISSKVHSKSEPVKSDATDSLLSFLDEPASGTRFRHTRLASRRDVVLGGLLAVGAAVIGGIPLRNSTRFFPGSAVDGLDLSGLSEEEGNARISSYITSLETTPLTLRYGDRVWNPLLHELGFSIDREATIALAWEHGRDDGFLANYTTLLHKDDQEPTPLVINHDEDTLGGYLDGVANELGVAARDARLILSGLEVTIQESVSGIRLDADLARQAVLDIVGRPDAQAVDLVLADVVPDITTEKLEPAWQQANILIDGPITLTNGDQTWTIATDDVISALVLPEDPVTQLPYLDEERLASLLGAVESDVAQSPRNPLLQGGRDGTPISILIEGELGRALDKAAVAADMAKVAAASDGRRELGISFVDVQPDVRMDSLESLGISQLIGRGSSTFQGSSDARRENVGVAASHISRTLIEPGGTWSFNGHLGPITVENGYVEGKIIKDNWYADDIGGGVCQISTTVFRAALFGGFTFPEWHPHAFRVAFYELDGSPPGIDASIYQPNSPEEMGLDLIIQNPTDKWVYVQALLTGDNVACEIFGSPVDYDVTVESPKVSKPIKPGKATKKVDPKLKKGEKQKIAEAQPGYDVTVRRTFSRDGVVFDEQTFASFYAAQPEMWLVGPG